MKKIKTKAGLQFGLYTYRWGEGPILAVSLGKAWWELTGIDSTSICVRRIKEEAPHISPIDITSGYIATNGTVYSGTMIPLVDVAMELTRHIGLIADPLHTQKEQGHEYKDLQATKHFRRENKRSLKHVHH